MLKEIKGFSRFYVNELGEVFAVKKNKFKGEVLRPLSICRGANGYKKVNLQDDTGKFTSKLLHTIVYESFKGENYSTLALLDGDKNNCRLDNIISLEELIDYYNKNNNKKYEKEVSSKLDKECCCYNCKYLKKNNNVLKKFQCSIDEEILNCYNLRLESCNLYMEQ